MPQLELSTQQIVDLVCQLEPDGKEAVLQALSAEREVWWNNTVKTGEERLRQICTDRGIDWDAMSEDERETFVDKYLHE